MPQPQHVMQIELAVGDEKAVQSQVAMPELCTPDALQDVDHLRNELVPIGHRLAAQIVVPQELTKRHGARDRFDDDRIAPTLVDREAGQVCNGARRGNLCCAEASAAV